MRTIAKAMALFLLFWSVSGQAQDFQKGIEAYQQGDFETALEEWRPLAEQGHADAQVSLGAMYHYGYGVPQDYTEAAKWYRLAAEQGDVYAQFGLGVLYRDGTGVIQSYIDAHMWFNIAASAGNESAKGGRDRVATEMSQDALVRAQRLAQECLERGYKDC